MALLVNVLFQIIYFLEWNENAAVLLQEEGEKEELQKILFYFASCTEFFGMQWRPDNRDVNDCGEKICEGSGKRRLSRLRHSCRIFAAT